MFALFNALSFQIVLSSPMVLYAKSLGASATVIGLLVGLMPLLVIFQIPAAQYVHRVGYKRFVYAGWGTRVLFIFFMALVPLTSSFLNPATQIALILALTFAFSLSRGISSAAWLPWITLLVPPALRGKYLSRDAACTNLASFITFLVAASCLGPHPTDFRFAALFLFSALMGATSLFFLGRIPDISAPELVSTSSHPVPWLQIARYQPFRHLLRLSVVWSIAYGGMQAFTVSYLRGVAGLAENEILLITSIAFLGGLSSLWFLGSRLDSLGSKPVLTFAFLAWLLINAGWTLLAGRALPPTLLLLLSLQFLMGLFAALVTIANMRLAMALIPVMGRNHFFALFTVVGSVSLGLAPIGWGLIIDAVGQSQPHFLGLEWNRYTVFFAATWLLMLTGLIVTRYLEEPAAVSMEQLVKEILIASPQRLWVRFWPRS
jgi:MFS family permease